MNKTAFVALILVIAIGALLFIPNKRNEDNKKNDAVISLLATIAPSPTSVIQFISPFPTLTPTQPPTPTPTPETATVQKVYTKATIKTSKGDIQLDLYYNEAPKTIDNFVKKAKSNFYNNLTFHRVEDWVIQGGDPKGNGTGGGQMPSEFNNKPFVVGSVGVARGADPRVSNDSQFFITKKEALWLNGQYINFGSVTSGMDTVEKITIGDKILNISVE